MSKAQAGAQALLGREQWDVVISTGLVGSLTSSTLGTLLIAKGVIQDHSSSAMTAIPPEIRCDSAWSEKALHAAEAMNMQTQQGRIVTVSRVLCTAAEKQALAQRVEGIGVDMESSVIGDVATAQQIPFIVTRTVSDLSYEDLPMDFNLFQEPWGIGRGVWGILSTPKALPRLVTFTRQTRRALNDLSSFFQGFLVELHPQDFKHSHKT